MTRKLSAYVIHKPSWDVVPFESVHGPLEMLLAAVAIQACINACHLSGVDAIDSAI
jgi:hypothetical protein